MQEKDLLQEDKITEMVIDFEKLRQNQLDESFLRIFGNITKLILRRMYGQDLFLVCLSTMDTNTYRLTL